MVRSNRSALIAALALLVAMPALANDILCDEPNAIPCGPGLGGTNKSLRVAPDGGADKAYVQADQPTAEAVFSTDFRIDPQTVTLDNNKLMDIIRVFGDPQHHIRVHLQWKVVPANYKIWLWVRENSDVLPANKYRFVGKATVLPNTDNPMGIEWAAASGPGAGDGIARLLKNNNVKGERLNLDNDERVVNRFRAGLPNGSVGTGATGDEFLLDEFVLTRTIN